LAVAENRDIVLLSKKDFEKMEKEDSELTSKVMKKIPSLCARTLGA